MSTALPTTDACPDRADDDPDPPIATVDDALTTQLRALEAELLAMPPVAALGLRVDAFDGECLRLRAPLAPNINDKGCAFGGSLASLMTLTGWGLVSLQLRRAGFAAESSTESAAEVYVARSDVHYRAPLYADLIAEARPDGDVSWPDVVAALRSGGRARIGIVATVALPEGGAACECRARFVAIARAAPDVGAAADLGGRDANDDARSTR